MRSYLVSLLFFFFLLSILPSKVSATEASKDLCSLSRPAEIITVIPPEKSIRSSVSSVGADFRFTPQRKAEIGSFQLFLDGRDITSNSRFSSTRDELPSRAVISSESKISQEGTHRAEVRFQTKDGSNICYRWTFQVKRSPSKKNL
jgi:hypothetical protein